MAGVSDQENELLLLLIEHGVASPGPGLGAGVHLGAGNGEDLCCLDPPGHGPGEG